MQVASLQAEVSMVQSQVINSRSYVMAAQQQQQQQICYSNSNASSASNNLITMHTFTPNFPETNSFDPIRDDDDEQTHDPLAFANNIFQ